MASISVAHFPCLSHSCFQNELGSGLFRTSGQNCFRSSKILCSFSILKFSSDLQLDGPFAPYFEGHRPWMVQIELSSEIDHRFNFNFVFFKPQICYKHQNILFWYFRYELSTWRTSPEQMRKSSYVRFCGGLLLRASPFRGLLPLECAFPKQLLPRLGCG